MAKNEFKTEMELLNAVRLALADKLVITFRVNVGKVKMQDGRWFDTGLPKGFSDVMAITPRGQVCFIETKQHPRKPTREQINFMLAMINRGCPSGVAYTVQDTLDIVRWDLDTRVNMVNKLRGYYG